MLSVILFHCNNRNHNININISKFSFETGSDIAQFGLVLLCDRWWPWIVAFLSATQSLLCAQQVLHQELVYMQDSVILCLQFQKLWWLSFSLSCVYVVIWTWINERPLCKVCFILSILQKIVKLLPPVSLWCLLPSYGHLWCIVSFPTDASLTYLFPFSKCLNTLTSCVLRWRTELDQMWGIRTRNRLCVSECLKRLFGIGEMSQGLRALIAFPWEIPEFNSQHLCWRLQAPIIAVLVNLMLWIHKDVGRYTWRKILKHIK